MMDIQLLETFLVVCEEGNLSRAAVRLFRTQPAVTRQIQALETELGLRLLERNPRGVQPTPPGEELRLRAARILAELRGLADLGAPDGGPTGELQFACSDNVACHFLAPFLGRFAQECPRVRIQVHSGVTPGIANLVERGACELGIVLLPLRNPRLEFKPLLTYHHLAVYPPGQRPEGPATTLEALCERPLVLLTRESATRRSFDEAVSAKGLQAVQALEVGSVPVQKAMIRAGLGAGILPGYALEPRDGLEHLPIDGSHPKTLALCWQKHRALTPGAEHMAQMLGG
jgi:LysR family nitrogen assimilation transcriptional regulator